MFLSVSWKLDWICVRGFRVCLLVKIFLHSYRLRDFCSISFTIIACFWIILIIKNDVQLFGWICNLTILPVFKTISSFPLVLSGGLRGMPVHERVCGDLRKSGFPVVAHVRYEFPLNEPRLITFYKTIQEDAISITTYLLFNMSSLLEHELYWLMWDLFCWVRINDQLTPFAFLKACCI